MNIEKLFLKILQNEFQILIQYNVNYHIILKNEMKNLQFIPFKKKIEIFNVKTKMVPKYFLKK